MAIFFKPKGNNSDCCPCEDAVLCGCCGEDTKSYSESHGFAECPDVAKPCGSEDSGSCSGATIGPSPLDSTEFPEECFTEKKPKASFTLSADNYGYVQGQDTKKCSNFGTDQCVTCYLTGVVTPLVIPGKKGYKKMRVFYFAQNAPHGGPYSISVTVDFYFE